MTNQMPFYWMKIYNYQSGFRGNHSTNLCLSFLTDKVLKGFDKGLLTGMILIDLQKAFNTIDHEISLQKLKAIKFSESTVKWFKSYLSERIFLVNIRTTFFDSEISCGLPQGSILGPRLFLIYVNNMPQAVISTLLFYADDSYILVHDSYTKIRTSCKLKNDSMKTLKTFATGLLIANLVFILVRIKQNQFFLQVNREQRVSAN